MAKLKVEQIIDGEIFQEFEGEVQAFASAIGKGEDASLVGGYAPSYGGDKIVVHLDVGITELTLKVPDSRGAKVSIYQRDDPNNKVRIRIK